jgi:endo-1,4-beta-xylanase
MAGMSATVGRLRLPRAADAALKAKAAAKGILYGSSVYGPNLLADNPLQQVFVRECAITTPEAELKWGTLRPGPTQYNFGPGDALLQFCQSHGIQMRGHALAFWESIPGWFKSYATPANARQLLTQHIQTVCGHYAGKLHSWDVCNEIINPPDNNPDGLKNSPWLTLMGPDYIPLAFHTAREADPHAMLVYNDFGIEYNFPGSDKKRDAMLNLMHRLVSQQVPIQAFGLQAHLYGMALKQMNTDGIASFLKSVSDMGLKILITELDSDDRGLPADTAARDQAVAESYTTFLGTVLQNPNVIVVQTWGLTDKYTWQKTHAKRDDGLDVRVLPFDQDFNPKPVYQALAQAFDAAPRRTA